jgi:phospholipase C
MKLARRTDYPILAVSCQCRLDSDRARTGLRQPDGATLSASAYLLSPRSLCCWAQPASFGQRRTVGIESPVRGNCLFARIGTPRSSAPTPPGEVNRARGPKPASELDEDLKRRHPCTLFEMREIGSGSVRSGTSPTPAERVRGRGRGNVSHFLTCDNHRALVSLTLGTEPSRIALRLLTPEEGEACAATELGGPGYRRALGGWLHRGSELAVTHADENLQKIDHIVVLMMENRSFDHMLGFLKIELGRDDVDGPAPEMANTYRGETYHVHPAYGTELVKAQDPCHSHWCVAEQLANNSGGFVSNYMKTRRGELVGSPGVVMAYHPSEQLPVYAFLADQFCVCDRWFCSVPGATMPNRCYAVAGGSGGTQDNLKPSRPYNLASFVRHLEHDQWRWYSHDYVPMLWMIDPEYGLSGETIPSYFDRSDIFGHRSFLERAADGDLPAVSWIDPNFYDLTFGPAGSNDDHPPSNLRAGQKLVLQLFDAVVRGPGWPKTLLIITYDEHGGFFDHVQPPEAADDDPKMRRYGPRVPALVISPWVSQRQVSHTVFDHTSIIKTILTRFAVDGSGRIPDMGARVNAANHLGELLANDEPRAALDRGAYQNLLDDAARWHEQMVHSGAVREQPQSQALTDFQADFLGAKRELLAARTQIAARDRAG